MDFNRGFITEIILVLIVVIILISLFGVDLKSILESEALRQNAGYVWEKTVLVWNSYVMPGTLFVWNKVLNPYLWEPIKGLLEQEPELNSAELI